MVNANAQIDNFDFGRVEFELGCEATHISILAPPDSSSPNG